MNPNTITTLLQDIRQAFHCDARFIGTVRVDEKYKGRTLWRGLVGVFQTRNSDGYGECYAWERDEILDCHERAIFLKAGEVDSPSAAVRAHIARLSCEMAAAAA